MLAASTFDRLHRRRRPAGPSVRPRRRAPIGRSVVLRLHRPGTAHPHTTDSTHSRTRRRAARPIAMHSNEQLVVALQRPGVFRDGAGELRIRLLQTHISIVCLTGAHAYKVRIRPS